MEILRRINVSLALFVLICFFLPWLQVSCGSAHDTQSGLGLARNGEHLLWFIPFLMVIVFALGLGADWKRRTISLGTASLICGLVTAFLIYRERVTGNQSAGLLAVGMTGWFWLAFGGALFIAFAGLGIILGRRSRTPRDV